MAWWFFAKEKNRDTNDIEKLWRVFSDSLIVSNNDKEDTQNRLESSFNEALSVKYVGISKLTMGLYWIRPWSFPPLDKNSIRYIREVLGEDVSEKGEMSGAEYLAIRERMLDRFHEDECPVHSFPELSLRAFAPPERNPLPPPPPPVTYTVDSILDDGCFLAREKLDVAVSRLRQRKNLILQGPPGTGKTWLAKKLGYALIGCKEDRQVKRFQFHPNLSYEDFVRGYRPTAGRLDLLDGPFLAVITEAQKDPEAKYVVVIEEINRGNPAQIFGEMLTLLESDKRNKDEALALAVSRNDNERVYIPPNVYVIGTMNVADRSLALVDLALRRRFTFVDLEPTFGEPWRKWMRGEAGVDDSHLRVIDQRLTALNDAISADKNLGDQFRVGHSYVTTPPGVKIDDPVAWFREVVETEIAPLLREYWFDQTKTADDHQRRLLEGF